MKKLMIITLVIIICIAVSSCKKEHASVCATSQITDIDGNVYSTVKIGNQCWMKQNLKTAHYRDGSAVTEIENSVNWGNTGGTISMWSYCNGDSANNITYGKLYNWYAVTDARNLCPAGWHVPSDSDWHTLALTLDTAATWGGTNGAESYYAGGEMKTVGAWSNDPTANNSSGFSGLPAGINPTAPTYGQLGSYACFWSSTMDDTIGMPWCRFFYYPSPWLNRSNGFTNDGFSVRCVAD